MEFIINYWVILLVVFILFLLVLLSYLIDKEIRNIKDEGNDNIDSKLNSDIEKNYENDSTNDEIGVVDNYIDEKEAGDEFDDNPSEMLDYDELDVEDIDDDFNKVIHKKILIDNTIKDSVEAMKIDSLDIKEDDDEEKIELPDIKIKKDSNEDVWKK